MSLINKALSATEEKIPEGIRFAATRTVMDTNVLYAATRFRHGASQAILDAPPLPGDEK